MASRISGTPCFSTVEPWGAINPFRFNRPWFFVLCLWALLPPGCGPSKPVAQSQGVRVSHLEERFVPENSFVLTFQVENLDQIAKHVRLKTGISYLHPNKPLKIETTELDTDLSPRERRTLSAKLIVEEDWIGPYLDTEISRREPIVEIMSVNSLDLAK